ncbi:unnamed protein product [Euphydryas editha]|uniref:Uncharacterized protein n=1 Tax=Euphydryas editha TaxID=104508 RepID=A0AAU9TL92_EUPED|nr:unnamed protein product [Euphydryas editha]
MASIEVSLAGRRRSAGARDLSRELDTLRAALTDKDTLIQNLKKQLNASLSAARLAAQASSPCTSPREEAPALSADDRRALEERAAAVRAELETRRANMQELKRRLEKTHVTENIDTRIEQAELQYAIGREELELLTLGEQARALSMLIEQADVAHRTTLYRYRLLPHHLPYVSSYQLPLTTYVTFPQSKLETKGYVKQLSYS